MMAISGEWLDIYHKAREERDTLRAEAEQLKSLLADDLKRRNRLEIENAELKAENKRVNEERLEIWAERNKLITENATLQAEAAAMREALQWLKSISFSREDDPVEWPGKETREEIDRALSTTAGQSILDRLEVLEAEDAALERNVVHQGGIIDRQDARLQKAERVVKAADNLNRCRVDDGPAARASLELELDAALDAWAELDKGGGE